MKKRDEMAVRGMGRGDGSCVPSDGAAVTQEPSTCPTREEQVTIVTMGHSVRVMAEAMQRMNEMMQETLERMAELEKTVRTLEKVTPRQAAQVNAAMRDRAREICADWRLGGQEKQVAALIRKKVRETTGVRTAREIARCDCGTVIQTIQTWEDVDAIRKIRKGGRTAC